MTNQYCQLNSVHQHDKNLAFQKQDYMKLRDKPRLYEIERENWCMKTCIKVLIRKHLKLSRELVVIWHLSRGSTLECVDLNLCF